MTDSIDKKVMAEFKKKLKNIPKEIIATHLSDYLTITYITTLVESKGYGRYFKTRELEKLLGEIDSNKYHYDKWPYNTQINGSRKRIAQETGLLGTHGELKKGKHEGNYYSLPINKKELDILTNWYKKRSEEFGKMKPKRKKVHVDSKMQNPLFYSADVDAFYAVSENDNLWFYSHYSTVFNKQRAYIYIAFVAKGEKIIQVKTRDFESNCFEYQGEKSLKDAIAHGKKGLPSYYIVEKDQLVDFLTKTTDFKIDRESVTEWMKEKF